MPGWSQYYLDYKGLKKIVSSLHSGKSDLSASSISLPLQSPLITGASPNPQSVSAVADPASIVNDANLSDAHTIELITVSGRDEDRGPVFQAHKTAFFFKLERELEKVCVESSVHSSIVTVHRSMHSIFKKRLSSS